MFTLPANVQWRGKILQICARSRGFINEGIDLQRARGLEMNTPRRNSQR